MVSYARKAVRGASITLILGIIASLIAYLTRIVLARNLAPEEYGLFYAVFTLVIFFLFFRDLGLGQALIKSITEYRVQGKLNEIKTAILAVFSIQFTSSFLIAFFFYLLAPYLTAHYFKNPAAEAILKLLTLYVMTSIFFILTKQIFQSFGRISLFASIEPAKNALVLLLVLLFFAFNKTALVPALAYAFLSLILFAIYGWWLHRTFNIFRHKIVEIKPISRKLLAFGLPVFITDIGAQVIGYIDTIILTHYRTLAEVGIYNVVLPSALMFLFFSRAISSVTFPFSSELWSKNEVGKITMGLRLMYKYLFVLLIPVILAVIVYTPFFLYLFFGEKYMAGVMAFRILLVGVMFYVVASASNSVILGVGKPKVVTGIILISAAVNTALNLLLVPRYGIEGAAIATMVSYTLTFLLSTWKASCLTKASLPFREWVFLMLASVGYLALLLSISASLQLNPWLELVTTILISVAAYVLLLFLFGIVDYSEMKHYAKQVI